MLKFREAFLQGSEELQLSSVTQLWHQGRNGRRNKLEIPEERVECTILLISGFFSIIVNIVESTKETFNYAVWFLFRDLESFVVGVLSQCRIWLSTCRMLHARNAARAELSLPSLKQ